jgi:hypothetical protein
VSALPILNDRNVVAAMSEKGRLRHFADRPRTGAFGQKLN